MLAVMLLSQLEFRDPTPSDLVLRVVADVQCTLLGHVYNLFKGAALAICERPRPHLCMDEWNRPTPVHWRLSLTQVVWGKLIQTSLAMDLGIKIRSLDVFSQYSAFHLWFAHSEVRMPSPARLFNRFRVTDTNRRLDLSLSWQASEDPFKRTCNIWSESRDPR